MIEGGYVNDNPYINHPKRIRGVQEFPIAVFRLKNSFEQRIKSTPEIVKSWVDNTVQIGIDNNFFGEDAKNTNIERKIGSGFNTSVYLFTADKKSWVAKIGAKKAPVPGWFDPSSQEYAKWYANNLKIVHDRFKHTLPHLIPSPQYVTYPSNIDGESTSVIIQPYISDYLPVTDILSKPEENRHVILDELYKFYEGFEELYAMHNFIPDLGTKGNLVIQPVGDEYHLTLLDDGMIDLNAVSPVLNTWSMFRYRTRPRKYISQVSKSLK